MLIDPPVRLINLARFARFPCQSSASDVPESSSPCKGREQRKESKVR